MSRTVTQRELRNESGEIMRELDRALSCFGLFMVFSSMQVGDRGLWALGLVKQPAREVLLAQ